MLVGTDILFPVAAVISVPILFILRRRGSSSGSLVSFALFYAYITFVVGYTILPIVIDSGFIAEMRREVGFSSGFNAVPFLSLFSGLEPRQIVGNFALGLPFGFGFPFVASRRAAPSVLRAGLIFAVSLEALQLAIDIAYGFTYRAIDVNDVILIFAGVGAGYVVFRLAGLAYSKTLGKAESPGPGFWLHFHRVLAGDSGAAA